MAKGIEETKELIKGIQAVAVIGVETFKDGIQLGDFKAVGKVVDNFKELKDAIVGVADVDDELKDLDTEEIKELAGLALDLVKAIQVAAKKEEEE